MTHAEAQKDAGEVTLQQEHVILIYSIDPFIHWVFAQAKVTCEPAAARNWLKRALAWRYNDRPNQPSVLPQLEIEARFLFHSSPPDDTLYESALGKDIPRAEIEHFIGSI